MSSTGGKTGGIKLGSLALSVDLLAVPATTIPSASTPTATKTQNDSYAARLAKEHGKVLGRPNQADSALLSQFIDPPNSSVLKLKAAQILKTELSQKQRWKVSSLDVEPINDLSNEKPLAQPAQKEVPNIKPSAPPILEKSKKIIPNGPNPNSLTKIVAPRARPFSEGTHVRVKIIVQNIDLNVGHVGTIKPESTTWTQRDAIKHYLTLQDVERRRAATEGAVYRTFQHDA